MPRKSRSTVGGFVNVISTPPMNGISFRSGRNRRLNVPLMLMLETPTLAMELFRMISTSDR